MIITKTKNALKPVLLERGREGTKIAYYLIVDKEQVLFVVLPGLSGREFNKTLGYLSEYAGMQTYSCLYGSGILLMQRSDELGEAKEFKVLILSPLKQVNVPAGWSICLVNTGNKLLVVLRNSALDEKRFISKPIMEKQGFNYYVVDKKGEISFEPNSNYSVHPQITTE